MKNEKRILGREKSLCQAVEAREDLTNWRDFNKFIIDISLNIKEKNLRWSYKERSDQFMKDLLNEGSKFEFHSEGNVGPLKGFLKESDMIQFVFYNDSHDEQVQIIHRGNKSRNRGNS